MEARTGQRCKVVGGAVGRGEMPIEPGDSWFSPKCIEVQPQVIVNGGKALDGLGGRNPVNSNQTMNAINP